MRRPTLHYFRITKLGVSAKEYLTNLEICQIYVEKSRFYLGLIQSKEFVRGITNYQLFAIRSQLLRK